MAVISGLSGPEVSASEQVRRWIETPVEFWEECAREFGPVVALDLGSLGPVVLISDPERVKEVFQLSTDLFECRQFNEHYRYVMGEHSVLVQDGDQHRRQRRLLSPQLRPETVPSINTIRDIVLQVISEWPVGQPFNPRPSLHDAIFRVMVLLLLGDLSGEASRSLIAMYREEVLSQVGSWGPWRSFARIQPAIRDLLAGEVEARRADPSKPGLLTAVAQARSAAGDPIPDSEWQDHVFSLMVAGVDPTAISLAWSAYWLAREASVRQKLLEELACSTEVLSGPGLLKLPYLNAVFYETLRMYPVVTTPSGRKLRRETRLGPYTFPAGTTLLPCTYLVHRREDLYPDSGSFRPERFLERTYASYQFFPFGGGARTCLGEMLAEIEFKAALATVVRHWSLAAADPRAFPPSRHGTLLAPSDEANIVVRVAHREAAP